MSQTVRLVASGKPDKNGMVRYVNPNPPVHHHQHRGHQHGPHCQHGHGHRGHHGHGGPGGGSPAVIPGTNWTRQQVSRVMCPGAIAAILFVTYTVLVEVFKVNGQTTKITNDAMMFCILICILMICFLRLVLVKTTCFCF